MKVLLRIWCAITGHDMLTAWNTPEYYMRSICMTCGYDIRINYPTDHDRHVS